MTVTVAQEAGRRQQQSRGGAEARIFVAERRRRDEAPPAAALPPHARDEPEGAEQSRRRAEPDEGAGRALCAQRALPPRTGGRGSPRRRGGAARSQAEAGRSQRAEVKRQNAVRVCLGVSLRHTPK